MDKKENSRGEIMERLYSTPFIDKRLLPEYIAVGFGNTGFDICFTPKIKDYSFDFIPEGKEEYDSPNSTKYVKMLCVGLLEFHNLLNDDGKMAELGLDFSKTEYVGASSNNRFVSSMIGLFSKSEDKNILQVDSDLIEINVDKFKNLKKEDPLIEYLTKVSERAIDTYVAREL